MRLKAKEKLEKMQFDKKSQINDKSFSILIIVLIISHYDNIV